MSLITESTTGRLITIFNLTNKSLGVAGKVIPPGGYKQIKLATIQKNKNHMNELNELSTAGVLTAMLDSCSMSMPPGMGSGPYPTHMLEGGDLGNIDAPLSGEFQAVRDIFTAPATASINALKLVFLAPSANTTYSGTNFDGSVGQGSFDFARNVTITGMTGLGEALIQKDVVITGWDMDGVQQIETLRVSTGGQGASDSTTYAGVYAFKKIYSIYFPLDTGAGARGDYSIGFGNKLGFSKPLSQGGILQDFIDNVIPAAPTVVVSGTALPNGTYQATAALVPNGVRNYVVTYVPN